ncbi:hypothetical protein [Streptomyces canus]|uniref:hypothetical protein n=1 Tax=Streptomyces canus TaxID=58343 RepID=UPI00324E80FD
MSQNVTAPTDNGISSFRRDQNQQERESAAPGFVVMPPEALKFDHGGAHGGHGEGHTG